MNDARLPLSANRQEPPVLLPLLHIDHNHGTLVMRDVELVPFSYHCDFAHRTYQGVYARGMVVSGGATSRLFHVTSHRPYTPDTYMEWTIYGDPEQRIRMREDGTYYANTQTCG